jgi:hypothetical protein
MSLLSDWGVKMATNHVIVRKKQHIPQLVSSIRRPLITLKTVNIAFEDLRRPQVAQLQYGRQVGPEVGAGPATMFGEGAAIGMRRACLLVVCDRERNHSPDG